MRSKLIISGIMVSLVFCGYIFAEEDPKESVKESMVGEGTSGAVEVGNKICPVSGASVDVNGEPVKYEYKGKIYNLCCKMCLKDFKKNPEKYIKIVEESIEKEPKEEHGESHETTEEGSHGQGEHHH